MQIFVLLLFGIVQSKECEVRKSTKIVCNNVFDLYESLASILKQNSTTTATEVLVENQKKVIDIEKLVNLLNSSKFTTKIQDLTISNNARLDFPQFELGREGGIFRSQLHHLRYLNLRANNLTQLPWKAFEWLRRYQIEISIAKNPLQCDCSNVWLQNLDRLNQIEKVRILDVALNFSIAGAFKLPIKIEDFNEVECKTSNEEVQPIADAEIDCALPEVRIEPREHFILPNESASFTCELNAFNARQTHFSIALKSVASQGQTIYSESTKNDRIKVEQITNTSLRLTIANVQVDDAGWVICKAESEAGPTLAISALLVHAAPKIREFHQDLKQFEIMTTRIYVDLTVLSAEPISADNLTYTYDQGKRKLQLPTSSTDMFESRNCERHPILSFIKYANPDECRRVILSDWVADFEHDPHLQGNHIVEVCNTLGCDTASTQVRITHNGDDHPTHVITFSPSIIRIESHRAPFIWITTISLIALSGIFAAILFSVYRRKIRKNRKSANNDFYAQLFLQSSENDADSVEFLLRSLRPSLSDQPTETNSKAINPNRRWLHSLNANTNAPSLSSHPSQSPPLRCEVKNRHISSSSTGSSQLPLLLDAESVIWDRQIGEGCFSKVYLAYCTELPNEQGEMRKLIDQGPTPVAVKTVNYESVRDVRTLFGEAAVLLKLRHPNIVSFYGLLARPDYAIRKEVCLVFEYMPNGNLKNFLRDRKIRISEHSNSKQNLKHSTYPEMQTILENAETDKVPKKQSNQQILENLYVIPRCEDRVNPEAETKKKDLDVLTISHLLYTAEQISSALVYLAENKYIHRDIAARNCLVGECLQVKLSDFGMSKDVFATDYYRAEGRRLLPVRWLAPEAFQQGTFDAKTDIWSFGVLLWEIFAYGQQPWPLLTNEMVIHAIVDGEQMQAPPACPETIYDLMRACWNRDASLRPSAAQLYLDISNIRATNDQFLLI